MADARTMTDDQAAWVREHVLTTTQRIRLDYEHETRRTGVSVLCGVDAHGECDLDRTRTAPMGWVGNQSGYPIREWIGVWLADRTCPWRCGCACHEPARRRGDQLDLFAGVG